MVALAQPPVKQSGEVTKPRSAVEVAGDRVLRQFAQFLASRLRNVRSGPVAPLRTDWTMLGAARGNATAKPNHSDGVWGQSKPWTTP